MGTMAQNLARKIKRWMARFFHLEVLKMDSDDIEHLRMVTTSRDYRTGHPELVKRVKALVESYKRMFPNREIIATCVYRSPDEQERLYAKGRFGNPGPIVTNCDGRTKKSNHNCFPARAVDVAILDGGKAVWDESGFWSLGALAKECDLVWGGNWTSFQDFPHLELPKEVA